MAQFYVVEGDYLVSHGYARDGCEYLQARKGQSVVLGAVPGFGQEAMPQAGGRWNLVNRGWEAVQTTKDIGNDNLNIAS
ncbi:MAG: hypothetical protein RL748_4000 [Pseudomonadota bacterium]|jgi:hypothetical protein